jgi:hypothetical protein
MSESFQVPSRPSGFFLKPVPNITPSSNGGSSLLSFKRKDLIWVITFFILLSLCMELVCKFWIGSTHKLETFLRLFFLHFLYKLCLTSCIIHLTGLPTRCRCGWTFYLSWWALPCLSASSNSISWGRWFHLPINCWCEDGTLPRWA